MSLIEKAPISVDSAYEPGVGSSNLSGRAYYLKELAEPTRREFPERASFVPSALSGRSRSLLSS